MLKFHWVIAASVAAALSISVATAQPDSTATVAKQTQPPPAATADKATVDKLIADWPERPKMGAHQMISKYGQPQEATPERLIWNNAGPFKRIMVIRAEAPHDFPMPHMDFVEHTITYNVPLDKTAELIEFDGSSTINRTVGELSARCDLEGHNILTLNLDHDIVTGKKTVEEARKAFGEIVGQDFMGKKPPYVEELQFDPAKMEKAVFHDEPVIPGSPMREGKQEDKSPSAEKMGDAEILATVIAIDLNEVLAATTAQTKKISAPVMDHAKMLHKDHGKHMDETMKLGQKIEVTPVITAAVGELQSKGAGELAALVPLDGEEFERAYTAAMVKGHTEALEMLDAKLKAVSNDELQSHLTQTRAIIAGHLERAKSLEGGKE